jgi:hypothetical protein
VGDRLFAYAVALVAAGANEALLTLSLGNPSPGPEMLRGWMAALPLLLACDVTVQLARRLLGRVGRWAAAAALAVLLLVPPVLAPYRDFVAADSLRLPPEEEGKPELALMTALPIIWGEGGAFDPNSRRPAAIGRCRRNSKSTRSTRSTRRICAASAFFFSRSRAGWRRRSSSPSMRGCGAGNAW